MYLIRVQLTALQLTHPPHTYLTDNMQHPIKVKQLQKTLAFQNNILLYKQIPKRYRSSTMLETPTESQSPLTTEFKHEFERIFFNHLT